MFFVVIREIEADRRDFHVFTDESDARHWYDGAAYVRLNDPDDSPVGDPAIVSNCWLYSVGAAGPSLALAAATEGDATLMARFDPPLPTP
jgi:hypothetical protein